MPLRKHILNQVAVYSVETVKVLIFFVKPRRAVLKDSIVTKYHKMHKNWFFWGNRQSSIFRVTVHRQKSFTENIRNSIVTPLRIAMS